MHDTRGFWQTPLFLNLSSSSFCCLHPMALPDDGEHLLAPLQ